MVIARRGPVQSAADVRGVGPEVAEHLVGRIRAALGKARRRDGFAVELEPPLHVAAGAVVEAGKLTAQVAAQGRADPIVDLAAN
jgi:hypothetical protein